MTTTRTQNLTVPITVEITDSASAQSSKWIFNFGSYRQLRAVREKSSIMNYELLLSSDFSCFHVIFFSLLCPH